MNVPAPPLNGLTGTAVHVPGVPGTGGGPVVGPPVGVGDAVRLGVALVVGGEVVGGLVVVGADVVEVAPLHVTLLRLKLVGAGFAEPFQLALNPNVAVPLVARLPFQAALAAVTALPLCVMTEFQDWVTSWPPA
jgi:hypothetical protein